MPNKIIPKLNSLLTDAWRNNVQTNSSTYVAPVNNINPQIDMSRVVKGDPTPRTINIRDKRVLRATTGAPMVPTRDSKAGIYPTSTAVNVVAASKDRGEDPWTPLGVAQVETGMGKIDPENPGHILTTQMHPDKADSAEDDLVYTLQQKRAYAKNLGYNDELHQIQAYNGLGKIDEFGSDFPQRSYYGVQIPSGGVLDFKKNPLYGKEVTDIRDNVLKPNKDMQNIVDTTGTNGGIAVKSGVKYVNSNYIKKMAVNKWINANTNNTIDK